MLILYLLLLSLFVGSGTAANELLRRAQDLFQHHAHGEAEQVLREALTAQSDQEEAMVLLGRVRANLGDLAEAEKLYTAALQSNQGCEAAWHARAKLFSYQKRWAEAEADFRRAVDLAGPNAADSMVGLARILFLGGDAVTAESLLRKSIDLDPGFPLAHFDFGVLLVEKGAIAEAAAAFQRAAELNPTLDMAVVAQVYLSRNHLWEGKEALAAALATSSGRNAKNWLTYAKVLDTLGEESAALAAYDAALAANPSAAEAHTRKGLLLLGCGGRNYGAQMACGLNVDEARSHLQRALELDPEQEEARKALAFCDNAFEEITTWQQRVAALDEGRCSDGSGSGGGDASGGSGSGGGAGGVLAKFKARRAAAKAAASAAEPVPEGNAAAAAAAARPESGEEPEWVKSVGGYRPVPVLTVATAEDFMRELVDQSRPALIKNLQQRFAPAGAWGREAMRERFGDLPVVASLSQNGRFDGPEDGALWGRPGEEILVRPPTTHIRFDDFLTLLTANLTEVLYLEYLATHQYLGDAVKEMIPLPRQAAESSLDLLLTNLWISKGGTTAVLHYDDYENLLCQIRGRKELTIFPPAQIGDLYYVGRKKGHLQHEYPGIFKREGLADSHAVVFASSVHLEQPDLERHPGLLRCTPYRVVLEPGDTLYMPAYWHHEVKSLPDDDGLNVAVNFWFRNVTFFAEEEAALRRPTPRDEL